MIHDVAVVGTGPAGATAARWLAQAGLSVVMLEKEQLPRYKVCGGGLVYRGRLMLDDLDLAPAIEREVHVARLTMLDSGLAFEAQREKPIISMVMRAAFDRLLTHAAEDAGATLRTGFAVDRADFSNDAINLHAGDQVEAARLVIAADGASSTMARLCGWPAFKHLAPAIECELEADTATLDRYSEAARFDFDLPSNGYSWVFAKRTHLSVGVGRFGGRKGGNLHTALAQYLDMLQLPPASRDHTHGFVVPLKPRSGGFVRRGVFLVGDAAGFADPVSAEGISNAILSGGMAAAAIVDGGMVRERCAALYEARVAEHLLPELAAGRKLARLFYASANLRDWLMRQQGERMVEAVAGIIMGERRYVDYAEAFFRKLKLWQR